MILQMVFIYKSVKNIEYFKMISHLICASFLDF